MVSEPKINHGIKCPFFGKNEVNIQGNRLGITFIVSSQMVIIDLKKWLKELCSEMFPG
jgi:hypothetical protein